jgi:diguanylate cyclase (GGDEF)-like protein
MMFACFLFVVSPSPLPKNKNSYGRMPLCEIYHCPAGEGGVFRYGTQIALLTKREQKANTITGNSIFSAQKSSRKRRQKKGRQMAAQGMARDTVSFSTETLEENLQKARYLLRCAPKNAIEVVEALIRDTQSGNAPAIRAEAIALRGLLYCDMGDYPTGEQYAQEAMSLLTENTEARTRGRVLYAKGVAAACRADYVYSLTLLYEALELAQAAADREGEADALNNIAFQEHRKGDFQKAVELALCGLHLAETIGYSAAESSSYNALGNAYDRLGDYLSAIQAHQQAIRIRQEIGDQYGEACSLNNLGNVYIQLEEWDTAIAQHEKAFIISEIIGYTKQTGVSLGNIALAYQAQNDFSNALLYHYESLEIKNRIGDRQGTANTLGNLGNLLLETEAYAEAEPVLEQALALNREISDRHSEAHCLLGLGKLYSQWHDPERNPDGPKRFAGYLEAALHLARENGSREVEYLTHEVLAQGYKAVGNFECALQHWEAFYKIRKSLFTAEMAEQTRKLQVQHEVEQTKKEAEIHRLRTIELTAALSEADRLREIAERLAREDVLTGLLTRRYGEERFAEAFLQAQRYRRPLSIVLADVDHFKRINDTFSHQTGDCVLRTVARLFREACRTSDTIARFGGEEFLFVLPETDKSEATAVCERIRASVENFPWSKIAPNLQVTISMGISDDLHVPLHERMLSAADALLYTAKNSGRNRVCA